MSISVENLCFSYGRHRVLDGLGFTAEDGRLLALLGPNGAGKTTLFRCILGLLRRYEGRIAVDGEALSALSPRELAHRLAYIPQSHGHTFDYSVRDMVLMGTSHRVSAFSEPRAAEREAAERAMEQLGLTAFAQKTFSHLSGGEQQLVLIARALAQGSRTLLMDEPTASLDYGNQALVLSQARRLADAGYCVMLSTHDPQHALWYADSALALLHGRAEVFGPPREVLDAALIQRLYGRRVRILETEDGPLISPFPEGGRHAL